VTAQRSLFDLAESRRRRNAGRTRASSRHAGWLEVARIVAVDICRRHGTVSADDLREAGIQTPAGASYNVWGSVFNDPRFVHEGYTQSKRPEAHANLLRVWRLA
jgi:hypothetical protein